MNRMMRSVIAVIFVVIISLSAVSICQNLTRSWRMDITDQKIYTLSQGTKNILAGLNQPLKMKLYYTKTAALKGPDQIKYFNNYYYFVKALLDEYVSAARGKVELQIIDPRPFSDEEVEALVEQAISETGASGPQDMGIVMKALMPKVKGAVDGKLLSEKVQRKLAG